MLNGSEFRGRFYSHSKVPIIDFLFGQRAKEINGTILEEIKKGTEGPKYRVKVSPENSPINNTFVLKIVEKKGEGHSAEAVLQKYLWLKKNNLPIVPQLMVDGLNNWILMTDLENNGELYLYDEHNITQGFQIKNSEEIARQVLEVAIRTYANGKGIALHTNSYSILMDQSNMGKLYLLDLGIGCQDLRTASGSRDYLRLRSYTQSAFMFIEGVIQLERRKLKELAQSFELSY